MRMLRFLEVWTKLSYSGPLCRHWEDDVEQWKLSRFGGREVAWIHVTDSYSLKCLV